MDDFISLEEIKEQSPSNKKSLQDSVDELNRNISLLVSIFKEANQTMKTESFETKVNLDPVFEKLNQIIEQNKKIDIILDQNRKIAEGLIAVAELVKKDLPKLIVRPEPRPQQIMPQPLPPMPMQMQQPRMMPMQPGMPPAQQGLPPLPPPPAPKKKGLF